MGGKTTRKIAILLIALLIFNLEFLNGSIMESDDILNPLIINNFEINSIYKLSKTTMGDGHILFSPLNDTNTYLINRSGEVYHIWPSDYRPGIAVWWLSNGTILRTIRIGEGPAIGGVGGGVQKINWDGEVLWEFQYNGDKYCTHHDVKTLPNGNVLMIAWENKSYEDAVAAGRDPNNISRLLGFLPDFIIEVKPTGPTTGDIVWEWHVWDHLIQEFDCTKANFGKVKIHPELVDINYQTDPDIDWMHSNSVDYNQDFDQIMISVRHFNEIWVIDHSTTTEEAAGHTGGNSGKGGDLLYRWGNPAAYQRGTIYDQKLFFQHDAQWIDDGCPEAGNILVYNNGNYRPAGNYTSVDEIIPPVDQYGTYYIAAGGAYGPAEQYWIYTANPPTSFFTEYIGGALRLTSGNTLISNGVYGKIFEVTPQKMTIWQYETDCQFFKAVYVPPWEPEQSLPSTPNLDCFGSLSWTDIDPGETVTGSFQVQNIGDACSLLNWTIDASSVSWGTWTFSPESGEGLTPEDGQKTVEVSVVAPNESESEFYGYILVKNQDDFEDYELISIYLKTSFSHAKTINTINNKWYWSLRNEIFSQYILILYHMKYIPK